MPDWLRKASLPSRASSTRTKARTTGYIPGPRSYTMRVAVIGAGASGIAAVRHLAGRPGINHVVAYEQNRELGGTWVYTDQVGEDERGIPVHSSMYKDLWSNLPVEMMQFQDLGYKDPVAPGSYVPQERVLGYLNHYVDHFDIRKHFQLETQIVRVEPSPAEDGRIQWRVDIRRLGEPQRPLVTEMYDAIFVCNGTYTKPRIPELPGLDTFKGHIMHSHDFRTPDRFEGKRVMCVGGGFSGLDISIVIARKAKQVYVSHRNPLLTSSSVFPYGIKQVPCIKEVRERTVVLEDGQEPEVDAIMLCTGYRYSFPFLTDVCQPKNDSGRLTPLYKHVVHVEYPTLCFIGMVKLTLQFQVSAFQVEFALATLLGDIVLPSKEAMLADINDDFNWRRSLGLTQSSAHNLYPNMKMLLPYQNSIQGMTAKSGVLRSIPEDLIERFDKQCLVLLAEPTRLERRPYVT